jgi:DNA-binding MarR family transcriptional regulator
MKATAQVRASSGPPRPRISYAIARLQQLVLASVSERVAPSRLTALQFTTLSVLGRHGAPLSNSQLARRSFMTPQSMHEVIHRLEHEGLISRDPHPTYRRRLPASLTAKGRRILATCEGEVADFEEHMLRGFGRTKRTAFLGMITAAVRNLGGGFGEMEASSDTESGAPDGTAPAKSAVRGHLAPPLARTAAGTRGRKPRTLGPSGLEGRRKKGRP